jgi:HEAT repeat protein
MRRELTRELGGIILGFYDGDDPAIHDGFLRIYERRLGKNGSARPHEMRQAVRGLAQVRSEAATDLLLEALDRVPADVVPEVVLALAYQGNVRALPALEALRQTTRDAKLLMVITSAIKALR